MNMEKSLARPDSILEARGLVESVVGKLTCYETKSSIFLVLLTAEFEGVKRNCCAMLGDDRQLILTRRSCEAPIGNVWT